MSTQKHITAEPLYLYWSEKAFLAGGSLFEHMNRIVLGSLFLIVVVVGGKVDLVLRIRVGAVVWIFSVVACVIEVGVLRISVRNGVGWPWGCVGWGAGSFEDCIEISAQFVYIYFCLKNKKLNY